MTNHPPSVLWHCWLGHQTCKNRRPYNLYCVGADVKPCSINQIARVSHQYWTRNYSVELFKLEQGAAIGCWCWYFKTSPIQCGWSTCRRIVQCL